MPDFSAYVDRITDFLAKNQKKALIACAALMALLLVLLIAVAASGKKSKVSLQQKELVINQPLLIPAGPEVPDGYITARKTQKNWSAEDVELWFTKPDKTELENLSDANNRLVDSIIGAAP